MRQLLRQMKHLISPTGGNNSCEDVGGRELLQGMQESRRGRPLGPLDPKLSPEMTAWALRLREFYQRLGLTLGPVSWIK